MADEHHETSRAAASQLLFPSSLKRKTPPTSTAGPTFCSSTSPPSAKRVEVVTAKPPPPGKCTCVLTNWNTFEQQKQLVIKGFVQSSFFREGLSRDQQKELLFRYVYFLFTLPRPLLADDDKKMDPKEVVWTHFFEHVLTAQERGLVLSTPSTSTTVCHECTESSDVAHHHLHHKAVLQKLKRLTLSPLLRPLTPWQASSIVFSLYRSLVLDTHLWALGSRNDTGSVGVDEWNVWRHLHFGMAPQVKPKEFMETWMQSVEEAEDKYATRTEKWKGPMKMHNGYPVSATCDTVLMKLDRLHGHARDASIAFDAGPHYYWLCGQIPSLSVTGFIHQYFKDFDPDKTARRMLRGNKKTFPTLPRHEKYKTLPIWCRETIDPITKKILHSEPIDVWELGAGLRDFEEAVVLVIALWKLLGDDASTRGTKMHRSCELFLNDEVVDDDSVEFQHHAKGWFAKMATAGYTPFRTEQNIYSKEIDLAGQVDIQYLYPEEEAKKICNCGKRHLYLGDFKRARRMDVENEYGDKGMKLCHQIDDSNYGHYTLQLNIYKFILERYYDVHVLSSWILVFSPVNDNYLEFKVEDKQDLVRRMYEERRREVNFQRALRDLYRSAAAA